MAISKKSTTVLKESGKLSLVIPCYNEEKRIPQMISSLQEFTKKSVVDYEIIVVDDGSTDRSVSLIESNEFLQNLKASGKFRLIHLPENKGKGFALKAGVDGASGSHILTLDADMSSRPSQIEKWLSINNNRFPEGEIWIASREHPESKITEQPSRRLTGRLFNLCVRLLTPLRHRDTQCGFKIYPAVIAKDLFSKQRSTGWAHDVELLYRARQNGILVRDLPVNWETQSGSKISALRDSLPMFLSVLGASLRLKWEYYVTNPIAILRNKGTATDNSHTVDYKDAAIFRMAFFFGAIILFIVMTASSFHFGITGDERVQKEYGEKVLSFFTSLGKDRSALEYKNLYLYGGFFDMICAAANRYIGLLDPYDMRHLINAIFGFIMIVFAALIATRIGNWRSGFIALIFLAISPQLFGQSMNNPKDIPFAAAYVFTIYQFYKWISELPKPSLRTLIYSSLGIAATIGIRVGGLLLIGILIVFLFTEYLFNAELRASIKYDVGVGGRMVKHVLLVVAAGYFGAMLFWPYGLLAPFSNPFTALKEMQNFSTNIRILFSGKHIMSNEIPWNYIPQWISITTPLIILSGAVLMMIGAFFLKKYFHRKHLILLLFVIIFPWSYSVYKNSPLYDGLRHFLFIVPFITVLSALFYELLYKLFSKKMYRAAISIVLITGIMLPLSWSIRNHPNEYCYFNELVGGINGAYGNYETDYWMNSTREASAWLKDHSTTSKASRKQIIATNCAEPVVYYFRNDTDKFKIIYVRYYSRAEKDWDYGIFYSRFIDQSQLKNKSWPNTHTIYKVMADDVPLSIVVERKDKSDLYAADAIGKKEFMKADSLYTRAAKYDPLNEEAWVGLGNAQLQLNKIKDAIQSLSQSLRIFPANAQTMSLLGLAYAQSGQTESAIAYLNQSLQVNPDNPQAYYYLGMIYQQKGDQETAQRYFDVVKQFQQRVQQ
ncbi:MAG: glycosyltransferase [Chitinophagales bacterium]|nr:glycosyltransferase [Chitinophagales bacterium]